MRRTIAVFLCVCYLFELAAFAGLGSSKSEYIGGTVNAIPKSATGIINTDDAKQMSFKYEKGELIVPYDKVEALSYGQHAGRRVGATVALGVTTLGVGALPMLLSKKRRHYLTLEYTDGQGAKQAAIFEIGKDAIRTTLKSLEVRTGKKVEYEDDEARKAGNK